MLDYLGCHHANLILAGEHDPLLLVYYLSSHKTRTSFKKKTSTLSKTNFIEKALFIALILRTPKF